MREYEKYETFKKMKQSNSEKLKVFKSLKRMDISKLPSMIQDVTQKIGKNLTIEDLI